MNHQPKNGSFSHEVTIYLQANEELGAIANQVFLSTISENNSDCVLQDLNDVELEAISRVIKIATFIKTFKICNRTFSSAGFSHLANALSGNRVLVRLDLKDCALLPEDVKLLGECISTKAKGGGAPALEELDLSNTQLHLDGLESIVKGIGTLSAFKILWLQDNQLPAQAGLCIGKVMRSRPGLTELYAAGNDLGDCGVAAIGGAIAADTRKSRNQADFSLKVLDLSRNDVGCEGLGGLLRGLATVASLKRAAAHEAGNQERYGKEDVVNTSSLMCPLQVLRVEGNLIADLGATKLADMLGQTGDYSFIELDLGNNRIGSEGVAALCSALKTNSSLASLNLAGCQLDVGPLRSLASMITANKHLTYLDISPNPTFKRALADATLVQRLNTAFSEVVAALGNNSVLQHIELGELSTVLGMNPGLETMQHILKCNSDSAKAQFNVPFTTTKIYPEFQAASSPPQSSTYSLQMHAYPLTPATDQATPVRRSSHTESRAAHMADSSKINTSAASLRASFGNTQSVMAVQPMMFQSEPAEDEVLHATENPAEPDSQAHNDPWNSELIRMHKEQQAVLANLSSQLSQILPQLQLQPQFPQMAHGLSPQPLAANQLASIYSSLQNLQTPGNIPHISRPESLKAQTHTYSHKSDSGMLGLSREAALPLEPIPTPDQVVRLAEQAAQKAVEHTYQRHLKAAEQLVATEVEGLHSATSKLNQELRWVDEEGMRKRLELESKLIEIGTDLKAKFDEVLASNQVLSERLDRVEQIVGLKNGDHLGTSDMQTLSLRLKTIEDNAVHQKEKNSELLETLSKIDVQNFETRLTALEDSMVREHEANLKVLEALLDAAKKRAA